MRRRIDSRALRPKYTPDTRSVSQAFGVRTRPRVRLLRFAFDVEPSRSRRV